MEKNKLQTLFGIILVLLFIVFIFFVGWVMNKLITLATIKKDPWATFALILFTMLVFFIITGGFDAR